MLTAPSAIVFTAITGEGVSVMIPNSISTSSNYTVCGVILVTPITGPTLPLLEISNSGNEPLIVTCSKHHSKQVSILLSIIDHHWISYGTVSSHFDCIVFII